MRWISLTIITVISMRAAQTSAPDDPKALLLEVRKKVMLTLNSLPKYMCTETIERSMLEPVGIIAGPSCDDIASQKKKPGWKVRRTASDRLRLDVGVSDDSEMFSWVGEDRFEDLSLADLVGTGATSTGAFATFLGAIFGTNDARFTYNRRSQKTSSTLAEFGFVMPLEKSHYIVGNKLRNATVGYEGTFLVDKTTLTLVKLTVHAVQVPAELGVCDDTTTLDYEVIQLHGSEFLLPRSARFDVTAVNGNELDNHTTFSDCHEFRGESTLQFGASEGTDKPAAANSTPRVITIPAGLPFTIALTQSINTSTAAAGDIVKAKLVSAIRDKSKVLVVARNTPVVLRILQIERLYGILGTSVQSLQLGLKLQGIEIDGIIHPFFAELTSMEKSRIKSPDGLPHKTEDLGTNDRLVTREDLGSFDQMLIPPGSGIGYLLFDDVTENYTVRPGVEMLGKTAMPPAKKP
jgi:hypothetical protein